MTADGFVDCLHGGRIVLPAGGIPKRKCTERMGGVPPASNLIQLVRTFPITALIRR